MFLASIGASGAINGLIGAFLAVQAWRKMGFQDYSLEYPTIVPLLLLIAFEARKFWKGRIGRSFSGDKGGVDNLTHLGGLVSGAGIGYWIRYRKEGTVRLGGEKKDVPDGKDGGELGEAVMEVHAATPAVERIE